jgi:hypothetical protein
MNIQRFKKIIREVMGAALSSVAEPGFFLYLIKIRDPEKSIPDPGGKKAPNPGIRIRNTGFK